MPLFFKHMAFRTCITAGGGIPLSFIIIATSSQIFPQASPAMIYAILICLVFILTGGCMHFVAQQLIKGYIGQAQKWEQVKNVARCEQALSKALATYNTGFLVPWRKRKTANKLTGAMARFALTHDKATPLFINATKHFLKRCPHKTELAAQWLKKEAFYSPHDPVDTRLLTLLARTHKKNSALLPLLAHRFLASQRSDFEARTLYNTCHEAHVLSASMHHKIQELAPDIFTDGNGIMPPPTGDQTELGPSAPCMSPCQHNEQ